MPKIRSICIVDDSKGVRKLGETLLANAGFEVFTAEDGYAALTVIRDKAPDACLIDREMPNLDGLQLIQLLRAWGDWDDKPIAMLSSASSVFDRQTGLVAGADLYLTKPFTKDTVLDAINQLEAILE